MVQHEFSAYQRIHHVRDILEIISFCRFILFVGCGKLLTPHTFGNGLCSFPMFPRVYSLWRLEFTHIFSEIIVAFLRISLEFFVYNEQRFYLRWFNGNLRVVWGYVEFEWFIDIGGLSLALEVSFFVKESYRGLEPDQ